MNSITHTIHGLASSLLLNVGLTQVAQKLDPVSAKGYKQSQSPLATVNCGFPCAFTPKKGL